MLLLLAPRSFLARARPSTRIGCIPSLDNMSSAVQPMACSVVQLMVVCMTLRGAHEVGLGVANIGLFASPSKQTKATGSYAV